MSGRIPAGALSPVAAAHQQVRMDTALGTVRDQDALNGLLYPLPSLALDLLELRRLPSGTLPVPPTASGPGEGAG